MALNSVQCLNVTTTTLANAAELALLAIEKLNGKEKAIELLGSAVSQEMVVQQIASAIQVEVNAKTK